MITAFRRLKLVNHKLEASLGFNIRKQQNKPSTQGLGNNNFIMLLRFSFKLCVHIHGHTYVHALVCIVKNPKLSGR